MTSAVQRSVLVTEQTTSRVLLIDREGETLREWSGRPGEGWGLPNEAKPRRWNDEPVLLVTDSYGFVGAFDMAGGVLWSADVTRAADPHSIELLPGGELAIAGAVGDWVRVYTGLADTNIEPDKAVAEHALPGAHGLVWQEDTLWAIGHHHVVGLSWVDQKLVEIARVDLPTAEGHDLTAASSAGLLWATTRFGVYQLDTVQQQWVDVVPTGLAVEREVKSLGDNAAGEIVYARADEEWWTSTIHFLGPDTEMTLPGARIYKARWAWEGRS